jgi:hypothetical protein
MSPLIILAAMGGAYLLAKRREHGPTGNGPVTMPAVATPQIPDNSASRQGAPIQAYFPSGFTSTTTGPANNSPQGAQQAPSGLSMGSPGPSQYEPFTYSEISTPYTPVGAFTRTGFMRGPMVRPSVTQVVGSTGAVAPRPGALAPQNIPANTPQGGRRLSMVP